MKIILIGLSLLVSVSSFASTITCYSQGDLMPSMILDSSLIKKEGEGKSTTINNDIEVEVYMSDKKTRTFNLQLNMVSGPRKILLVSTVLRDSGVSVLTFNSKLSFEPEDDEIIQVSCVKL